MGSYMRLTNPLPRCVVADLVDFEASVFELMFLNSRTGPQIRCVWVNPQVWTVLRYLCEHRSCSVLLRRLLQPRLLGLLPAFMEFTIADTPRSARP
jgi:hypothetical protein